MLESLIIKVAGNWLIKKRLRQRYLHGNCARFLRHLLWRTSNVNNDWKLCNNDLPRKNKPSALTVVRKDNSWVFVSFRFAIPANMLKGESFAQTNLIHNHPSFSRDLLTSEQMEEVVWARKLVSFEWGITVYNSYFSLALWL